MIAVPALLLASTLALAAEDGSVEAIGEATIQGSGLAEAKKIALADALKRCIEARVGVYIESNFSAKQEESATNDRSAFRSKVQDTVLSHAEGYIEHYDVVDTAVDRDSVRVKVRARVFASKLESELAKVRTLLAAAGHPKLMVAIEEIHTSQDGRRSTSAPAFSARLEKELIARGFEIRRSKADADMIIGGRIEVTDKGRIEQTAGLAALAGQRRVEVAGNVTAVSSATNEVVSSKAIALSSIGLDEERAINRAFTGRGENAVKQVLDELLRDLIRSFEEAGKSGRPMVIELHGIKSFREQGRRFLEILGSVAGVSRASQRSFDNGALTVELQFRGTTSELEERVFAKVKGVDALSKLDVQSISGNVLAFKLE
jgi:hypothetical protein